MPEEDKLDAGSIGMRIQMIRGKMTQQEFARKINVKQSYISRYEKGRVPKAEVLMRIARFAKVSIEWLLTGKEPSYMDGYHTGYGHGEFKMMSQIDRKIIGYLSKLRESDKRILLKIMKKMLAH